MNNFNISGRIIEVGEKRGERAPYPILVETRIKEKPALVMLDVFTTDIPRVGWIGIFSGYLDSREWNGRRFPRIVVTDRWFYAQHPSDTAEYQQKRVYTEDDDPPPFDSQKAGDPNLPF